MTLKYDHLVGIPFEYGKDDCFSLARRFYADNFNIEIPNFARPVDWWEHGLDLYNQHFFESGFRVQDIPLSQVKLADGFLMAIRSEVPNHCAIYVGDGMILHHYYNRLSEVVSLRGVWRNQMTTILRHKDVVVEAEKPKTLDLMTTMPEHRRRRLEEALRASGQVQ
jgi:cell wall-associated NlpC family hydrolase